LTYEDSYVTGTGLDADPDYYYYYIIIYSLYIGYLQLFNCNKLHF